MKYIFIANKSKYTYFLDSTQVAPIDTFPEFTLGLDLHICYVLPDTVADHLYRVNKTTAEKELAEIYIPENDNPNAGIFYVSGWKKVS